MKGQDIQDETIAVISNLFNKLLNIYKTEFVGAQSIFEFLKAIPGLTGLDGVLEFIIKITDNLLNPEYKKFIINLHQEFLEYYRETQEIYVAFKKYWPILLDSIVTLESSKKQNLIFWFNNYLEFIKQQGLLLNYNVFQNNNNLLNGIKNFLNDLVINNGYFNIKTSATEAFTIGENIAYTPGKVIYQNDLIELIQYSTNKKAVYKVPLLIIPPCINKYYVLDLSEKNSLVKWLIDQGFIVYMISWVNPKNNINKQFEDYVIEGCLTAVNVITQNNANFKIHAVGYCIGGTLLGCLLAYMAKINDNRIISVTNWMSFLDFSDLGDLKIFINKANLDFLDRLMDQKGYLDGRLLSMVFSALRPADLFWPYFINNYLLDQPLKAFDILYWNADPTNLPADMYKFYLRNICLNNGLTKSDFIKINNIAIDLKKITTPVFSVAGAKDHIVPWRSVYAGLKLYGGESQFVLSSSGHVKGLINPPIDNKYSFRVNIFNKTIPDDYQIWLNNSIEHQGSWWFYWKNWLTNINNEKLTVTTAKKFMLQDYLRDAPGYYINL